MSKIIQDVKSGLEGIHGADESLRGKALSAANQLDPHPNDSRNAAAQAENRAIIDRGNQEMRGTDEHIAAREREHEGVRAAGRAHAPAAPGAGLSSVPTTANTNTQAAAAPAPAPAPAPGHVVAAGAIHENAPGSNIGNRLSQV